MGRTNFYDVGDLVRLKVGHLATIANIDKNPNSVFDIEKYCCVSVDGNLYKLDFTHIKHKVLSKIDDEIIEKFKTGKLVFHITNREDYNSFITIINSYNIYHHMNGIEYDFENAESQTFCVRFDSTRFRELMVWSPYNYYKYNGYEIVELKSLTVSLFHIGL